MRKIKVLLIVILGLLAFSIYGDDQKWNKIGSDILEYRDNVMPNVKLLAVLYDGNPFQINIIAYATDKCKTSEIRTWIQIYDFNKDGKADLVDYSDFIKFNEEREEIVFYRGRGYLKYIMESYTLREVQPEEIPISDSDIGVVHILDNNTGNDTRRNVYNSPIKLASIEDKRIVDLFSFADRLIARTKISSKTGERFTLVFADEIAKILEVRVIDYPAEWRIAH